MGLKSAAQVNMAVVARQTGKLVLLALATLVLCVLSAILVFWLFYEINTYDSRFGAGQELDAFKSWFWFSYGCQLFLAVSGSFLLSRVLRAPLIPAVIAVAVVIAPFAWLLLGFLTFTNACYGVNAFPLGSGDGGC